MILPAIMFYLFSAVAIASGAMVVAARNPVHSVLFLILAFFNAAGLFVLMGAEFLAMILIIVYVGAVAVLFLFVVMMLDIDFAQLRSGMVRYLPIGAFVGFLLLAELVLIFGSSVTREMPLPFFPLRGVLVSIDVLHPWSGFCDRAGESRPLESGGKLAAFARDGHGNLPSTTTGCPHQPCRNVRARPPIGTRRSVALRPRTREGP